ncbi:hypothetical protein EVAR_66340_1 [Eumeta japonica]|uniref:Uncharacterized protein n=1 Tax=Eumeta variegata TaxID=151549 RepID=A0A4C2A1P6_EUMVA|nr:hypothetical protein EVAR_66340_1 [Eumeta japonica]
MDDVTTVTNEQAHWPECAPSRKRRRTRVAAGVLKNIERMTNKELEFDLFMDSVNVDILLLWNIGSETNLMSYGILLWGRAAHIHRIFVLRKRLISAIYDLGPRVSLRKSEAYLRRQQRTYSFFVLNVHALYFVRNPMPIRRKRKARVTLANGFYRHLRPPPRPPLPPARPSGCAGGARRLQNKLREYFTISKIRDKNISVTYWLSAECARAGRRGRRPALADIFDDPAETKRRQNKGTGERRRRRGPKHGSVATAQATAKESGKRFGI